MQGLRRRNRLLIVKTIDQYSLVEKSRNFENKALFDLRLIGLSFAAFVRRLAFFKGF